MFTIDFDQLTDDVAKLGMDVYDHPHCFWHFCLSLMEDDMVTTDCYHYGECILERNTMPNDHPITKKLDLIFDHYKVDEIKLTAKVGR